MNYNLNTENVTGIKYAYAAKWQTECTARTGAWERRSQHKAMQVDSKDGSVVAQKIQILPKPSMRPEMNSLHRWYLSLQSDVYSNCVHWNQAMMPTVDDEVGVQWWLV